MHLGVCVHVYEMDGCVWPGPASLVCAFAAFRGLNWAGSPVHTAQVAGARRQLYIAGPGQLMSGLASAFLPASFSWCAGGLVM